MGRFQGSLEYLIILGAAVLIAAIVVSYMFGLLGEQTKANQQNTCTKFIKELCNAMLTPQIVGKTRSDQAVALYIRNNVYSSDLTTNASVSFSEINNISVTDPAESNAESNAGSFYIQVNPTAGTLSIQGKGGFYIQSNGKIYVVAGTGEPIAPGDYACWGNGLTLPSQYNATINCRELA